MRGRKRNAVPVVGKTSGIVRLAHDRMANPVLFAEFADLNPEGECFSAWAEEHGGNEGVFSVYAPRDEREWRREHLDLSFAVMLREMILRDDMRLNGIFEWNEEERRTYVVSVLPRLRG
jgi:hypothetical protein